MNASTRVATVLALVVGLACVVYGGRAASGAARPSAAKRTGKPRPFAIRDVRVFDGERFHEGLTVLVDNGQIVRAGAWVSVPDDAEIIEGSGKTLLPGLIDAHTHAFGDALADALRFGVTSELDMFTSTAQLRQWKSEQQAGKAISRADIFSAGTLVTVKGGHGTEYGPVPTFTPGGDAQAFVDARIAEGSDYIKIVHEDGSPYAAQTPTLGRDDIAALAAAAHKRGKLAVVHVSTLNGARMAFEAGADGLAHLFGDRMPDPGFGKFVAGHGGFVIPTLTVLESAAGVKTGIGLVEDKRLQLHLSKEQSRSLRGSFPGAGGHVKAAHAMAAVRLLRDSGVAILAGSDAPNPGTAHGASIHRELELLVAAGLTPAGALAAATSVPARVFRLADRGTIAKGKRADLLLVAGDPSKDISATRNIAAIWKEGRLVDRKMFAATDARPVARVSVPEGLVSDFESGEPAASVPGGKWTASSDQIMGGQSSATAEIVAGGAGGSGKALEISGEVKPGYAYPWAGTILLMAGGIDDPVDVRPASRLTFRVKGAPRVSVMLFSESHGQVPAGTVVDVRPDWTPVSIPLADLGTDGSDIAAIFIGGTEGKFRLRIDDVRLE